MKNEVIKQYTVSLDLEGKVTDPALYRVIIDNDDFTPMEFVIGILEKYFYMDRARATEIMMEAHLKGSAACGIFTKDIAESIVSKVVELATSNEYPLNCSMEVAK
jgi:ATP-dependent Clp protease adaptor protein ClpS